MAKFLIPVLSAAALTFISVSAASAGAWGAFYPNGAHDESSDQSFNERSGRGGPKDQKTGPSSGNGSSYSSGRGNSGGGYSGGSGGYTGGSGGGSGGSGGGTGVTRSAPGPVLGLGLPAFVVAGGYIYFRRRGKQTK